MSAKSILVKVNNPTYNSYQKVQSIFPAHIKYEGQATKASYEWLAAGDIVLVHPLDVEALLEKRIGAGRACCGAKAEGNKVFILA